MATGDMSDRTKSIDSELTDELCDMPLQSYDMTVTISSVSILTGKTIDIFEYRVNSSIHSSLDMPYQTFEIEKLSITITKLWTIKNEWRHKPSEFGTAKDRPIPSQDWSLPKWHSELWKFSVKTIKKSKKLSKISEQFWRGYLLDYDRNGYVRTFQRKLQIIQRASRCSFVRRSYWGQSSPPWNEKNPSPRSKGAILKNYHAYPFQIWTTKNCRL